SFRGCCHMRLFFASILLAGTAIVGAATALSAQESPQQPAPASSTAAQLGAFGFDETGMDKSIKPGDDFYGFANGTWAKNTPIPADKSNYGMFTALDDLSKERVKGILDAVKGDANSMVGRA